MLCIILLTADVPIICTHRFNTTWIVALSNEIHLVLCQFGEIHTTLVNHFCNRFESLTCPNRVRAV